MNDFDALAPELRKEDGEKPSENQHLNENRVEGVGGEFLLLEAAIMQLEGLVKRARSPESGTSLTEES